MIVSYLVNSAWQVALVAVAGWFATQLLKRMGPESEHRGWVLTWMLAVLIPILPVMRHVFSFLHGQQMPGAQISILNTGGQNAGAGYSGLYQLPDAVMWLLVMVYAAVVGYFAIRLAWGLLRMRGIIGRAEPLELTVAEQDVWKRTKQLFEIESAEILSSSEVAGPVVAGLRRNFLIFPAEFLAQCSGEDFAAALAHECAHGQRRDNLKNVFYEAASVLLWFHPAVWMVKAQIAQTREMICDRMASEAGMEPRMYARSLLRLARLVASPRSAVDAHSIGIFDANILEKRIM
jgi:beta-lactamase regulating signal transducer with metallopeptidase domain